MYQIVEALYFKWFGKIDYKEWYKKLPKICLVFIFVNLAWVFFRSATIGYAFQAIGKMFTDFGMPFISPMAMLFGVASSFILFIKDFADEYHPQWKLLNSDKRIVSVLTAATLIVYVFLFGILDSSQFIYFQF